jgi:hypothetical protein
LEVRSYNVVPHKHYVPHSGEEFASVGWPRPKQWGEVCYLQEMRRLGGNSGEMGKQSRDQLVGRLKAGLGVIRRRSARRPTGRQASHCGRANCTSRYPRWLVTGDLLCRLHGLHNENCSLSPLPSTPSNASSPRAVFLSTIPGFPALIRIMDDGVSQCVEK